MLIRFRSLQVETIAQVSDPPSWSLILGSEYGEASDDGYDAGPRSYQHDDAGDNENGTQQHCADSLQEAKSG